jgi:hypothetical protein
VSAFNPDLKKFQIVILGDFNPKIVHPSWLLMNELISKSDYIHFEKSSSEHLTHSQISQFDLPWCTVQVTKNKFQISTEQEAYFELIFDLVKGIFSLLPHSPVNIYGLNLLTEHTFDELVRETILTKFGHNKNVIYSSIFFSLPISLNEGSLNISLYPKNNEGKFTINVNNQIELGSNKFGKDFVVSISNIHKIVISDLENITKEILL